MNKNFIRICVGAFLGIALLTVLMLLLETTALLWIAYAWSVWALVMFAIALGFWATGSQLKYVLFAAYPLLVKSYLTMTLFIAFLFGALSYAGIWSIKWGWFCLIELIVFAIHAWILQAMDTGKDEILSVEQNMKVSTISWKMLVTDICAIVERGSAADRKTLERTMEAIRFADPMEHPAVAAVTESISAKVAELDTVVEAGESAKIAEICIAIERLVKNRADKLLIVK